MTPDESPSPGSPRKKTKLEQSTSMDTEVEFIRHTPHTIHHDGQVPVASEDTSTAQNLLDPHHAPPPAYSESTPTLSNSTVHANMAATNAEFWLSPMEKERGVGITEFVCPDLLGFTGILKKRYTDFIVNEILPSGEVLHLSNMENPSKASPREVNKLENAPSNSGDTALLHKPQSAQKATGVDEERLKRKEDPTTLQSVPKIISNEKKLEETREMDASITPEPAIAPHLVKKAGASNSQKPAPKTSPAKETRVRQQYTVQHTEKGWAQSHKPNNEEKKVVQAVEKTSNLAALEEAFAVNPSQTASTSFKKDSTIPKSNIAVQSDDIPEASSTLGWQGFAQPSKETLTASKINEEDKNILRPYFTEATLNDLLSLYTRVLNSPRRATRAYGIVRSTVIDRSSRTKAHQDMRRIFNSKLETTTDKDGAIIVCAMSPAGNSHGSDSYSGRPERSHGGTRRNPTGEDWALQRTNWEELGGTFLHFTLYKENKDTMECANWLATRLRLRTRSFEFAGTKDRRAVTTQRMSVLRLTADRMIEAGRTLFNASIGDYEYRSHGLQLGELKGNEFTITLRDCKFGKSNWASTGGDQAHAIVSKALKNLVERGFVNYYGLQRFGTFTTSTCEIGLKLLQGDFEAAVNAILNYTRPLPAASQEANMISNEVSRDDQGRADAIHKFIITGSSKKAVDLMPRRFSAESTIIRHLGTPKIKQSTDYLGALLEINRNLRLMYVHAYQSLVWNMVASKRWSTYGDTVVDGDLVLVTDDAEKEPQPQTQEVDQDGEPIVQPGIDDRATNPEEAFTRARALSKEEAESGKYTIFDIVLPTPGFDVIYPANEIGKFYQEFMASPAGGGLDPYNMRRDQKDFSLSGNYRNLLARPGEDASFQIKTYEDEDKKFAETDMDRLKKAATKAAGKEGLAHESEQGKTVIDSDDDSDIGGGVLLTPKKIAVVLRLRLGSSQYATIALRELMGAGGVMTYKPDFGAAR